MTDLEKLKSVLNELGIEYKIEKRACLILTIINGWKKKECPIYFQLDGEYIFLN